MKLSADSGAELASRGRYREALIAFEEEIALQGDAAVLLAKKALTLDRTGLFGQALACCDKAIALDPRNSDAWFVRGLTLYYLARTKAAILCLGHALDLDPGHAEGWFIRGNCQLMVSQFFMIVLGGGVRKPLAWFKAPAVVKETPPDGGSWYRALVPDYTVQWHAIPGLSDWSVDFTKVQAFLLIATMAGAWFRFQGFASITALALLISIPVYLSFTWDWVVLFLISGSVSLYLQSRANGTPYWRSEE